jgi:3-oxoacyl-ACP reductase-like protein
MGKSTLQNEILGDLGKEFGSTPEKPEDVPLDELGASMHNFGLYLPPTRSLMAFDNGTSARLFFSF